MTEDLGACGAFIGKRDICTGRVIVREQVGDLLHGECNKCGHEAAFPAHKADPQLRRKVRIDKAGIPEKFLGKKFEETPENRPALEAIRSWLACLEDGVLPAPALWGEVGRGKSHLLAAVCVRLIGYDKAVMFTSTRALLRDLQQFDDRAVRGDAWKRATSVDVLALDDLGAQQFTDWRHDQIADLIEERYSQELPIIVATNFPPSQWEEMLDVRTASRLRGMTFPVELRGTDRRLGDPDPLVVAGLAQIEGGRDE